MDNIAGAISYLWSVNVPMALLGTCSKENLTAPMWLDSSIVPIRRYLILVTYPQPPHQNCLKAPNAYNQHVHIRLALPKQGLTNKALSAYECTLFHRRMHASIKRILFITLLVSLCVMEGSLEDIHFNLSKLQKAPSKARSARSYRVIIQRENNHARTDVEPSAQELDPPHHPHNS